MMPIVAPMDSRIQKITVLYFTFPSNTSWEIILMTSEFPGGRGGAVGSLCIGLARKIKEGNAGLFGFTSSENLMFVHTFSRVLLINA